MHDIAGNVSVHMFDKTQIDMIDQHQTLTTVLATTFTYLTTITRNPKRFFVVKAIDIKPLG